MSQLVDLGFERGLRAFKLGSEDRPNASIRVIVLRPMTFCDALRCDFARYRLPVSTLVSAILPQSSLSFR